MSSPPFEAFRIQDLPVELGRDILEIAARTHHRNALNLALVSRQISEWIRPVIYEMVTLGSSDAILFIRTMDSTPASFFARNVRVLCLTVSTRPADAFRILQTCTGVTSLACWVDFHRVAPRVPFQVPLAQLPLRRLSVEIGQFMELPLPHCLWLTTLTHLNLIFWVRHGSIEVPGLELFPSLTHLSISLRGSDVDETSLIGLLSAGRFLRILCIVLDEHEYEHIGDRDTTVIDPRIVYMPRSDNVPDWEAPYRGQPDTWFHAEEAVAEQMANYRSRSMFLFLSFVFSSVASLH
ncbi:hypothetical protein K435DRAFT_648876 [Dendrothele bispora CBS 962.96]|uniref:F-box domain-containing protein n=1 Tax=Dendrothele bispora (strain CBS 962.96) TaxID=1314807 RepID=A0A4S8MR20_DENBC|nr:hypothetical protein K435DRAFT_648876 [Dendrothele bispora CBS 962.96]